MGGKIRSKRTVKLLMLTSTIVLIVIRLFSVQWLVQGLSMLAMAIVELSQMGESHRGSFGALSFIPSLGMLLCSIVAWIAAPFLARFMAGKYDAPVTISGLSLQDLYAFAFVFLGLYFVLASLADVLNWLHYSLWVAASYGDFDPERKKSLYGLSRPLITLVAGLVCLVSGRLWAKKLYDAGKETP